jgi:DNA repair exonuclease SbcCD ATPase subunit
MSTQSIAQARTALAEAESAQREERRAQLITQLATTRAELRTARESFEKLCKQVEQGQSDLDSLRSERMSTTDVLSRWQQAKPSCVDLLPNEPESIAWRTNCAALEKQLEKLRAQRGALPNVEAMRFEGVQLREKIRQLVYAESSLLKTLNHETAPENLRGGTFGIA